MSTIGDRVKEARTALGLTQEELGKMVGYMSGRQAINKIEVGKAFPSQKYIVSLAEALGVSVGWLLGTTHETRPEIKNLLSSVQDCTAEEIKQLIQIVEVLKKGRV